MQAKYKYKPQWNISSKIDADKKKKFIKAIGSYDSRGKRSQHM